MQVLKKPNTQEEQCNGRCVIPIKQTQLKSILLTVNLPKLYIYIYIYKRQAKLKRHLARKPLSFGKNPDVSIFAIFVLFDC